MAIEIVDFPIKNGDFPISYVNVYWRVNTRFSPSEMGPWVPFLGNHELFFSSIPGSSTPTLCGTTCAKGILERWRDLFLGPWPLQRRLHHEWHMGLDLKMLG